MHASRSMAITVGVVPHRGDSACGSCLRSLCTAFSMLPYADEFIDIHVANDGWDYHWEARSEPLLGADGL